eukprot:3221440-Pyramimonas_sp.AAC.1
MAILGPVFETAGRMIDEAVNRSKTGAIQIFNVGGDHRCWQSENGTSKMNVTWDDIATLLRACMNQRIVWGCGGSAWNNDFGWRLLVSEIASCPVRCMPFCRSHESYA